MGFKVWGFGVQGIWWVLKTILILIAITPTRNTDSDNDIDNIGYENISSNSNRSSSKKHDLILFLLLTIMTVTIRLQGLDGSYKAYGVDQGIGHPRAVGGRRLSPSQPIAKGRRVPQPASPHSTHIVPGTGTRSPRHQYWSLIKS